jgi:hypothetical protein
MEEHNESLLIFLGLFLVFIGIMSFIAMRGGNRLTSKRKRE